MGREMKSRQLEAFRAVILRQSITRAAEMLHITQPAVTRLILDLETEIGFSLFTREKGRLFPTSDALLLYQEVERSFVGVERIAHAAQQIRSLTRGSLNVAAAPALALNLLPEWITDFTRVHEGVSVSLLVHGTRLVGELVASEQCDIGFVTYTTWQPGVRVETLFSADMKCILPTGHRLSGKRVIDPEDLAGEKFVSFTGDKVGDHLSPLTFFRDEMGFTGRVVGSSSSMTEVRRFIFAGFGIGCLPEHVVRDDIAQGRLQRLPPDEGVADLDIYMLWSLDRKLSAAEAAFIDALNAFIDGQAEGVER